jgi:hypothetical protein
MFKLALSLLMLPMLGAAWAQDADPPGRVARLGYAQGQVSIQPAGVDDWAAVDLNRPIATGDKLWADADSRAELSIGSALVRIASATAFSFLNLDDHAAQMQLTAGTVSVHVRSMSDTLEVDTPNVAVALLAPGDYRLEVNEAGDATAVKVAGGTAEVTGGGQDFAVHPQQAATFSGTTQVAEQLASLGAPDEFDTWAYDRDRQAQDAQAWSYVAPDTVGAEDLDQYGTWQPTPDEGYVWSPNSVVVGWAPYRFGHWIWILPWGWTWVDDAPWGFAPFHYGRWATFGGRWCWVPGPRAVAPVYAPALVAWAAGVPLSASAAFGGAPGVGWFPLGPKEVYVPAYPVSASYVARINLANTNVASAYVTRVFNHEIAAPRYINRYTPGAITAVPAATFTAAQPVGRNSIRIAASELPAVTVNATPPAITPQSKSVLGAGASGPGVRRPPPVLQNRIVLAKSAPAPSPVPFALVQQAIREHGGRPLARSELTAMQILAPAAHVRITTPALGAVPSTGMARAAVRRNGTPLETPATPATQVTMPRNVAGSPPAYPVGAAPKSTLRPERPPAPPVQPTIESRPEVRATAPAPGSAATPGAAGASHPADRPPLGNGGAPAGAYSTAPPPPPPQAPPAEPPAESKPAKHVTHPAPAHSGEHRP